MTPKCCQECASKVEKSECANYRRCVRWNKWFRETWAGIQEAARKIKEKKEYIKI